MREQKVDSKEFNASELCSRKLWQIVSDKDEEATSDQALQAAIEELATRRHYLAELSRMGKLGSLNHNA